MCREDKVDAPDGVDLDGNMVMERDGDDEEEADKEEEDEEEDDKEEEEDEYEEEDNNEDDGKEPQMIGQGEGANTFADDVDSIVDDQPIVLHEKGQEMRMHTAWPQPPVPAPRPQTPEPCPRPLTPETHPLSGWEYLELVTPPKPHHVVPTLWEAEVARYTSDVDVDQQLVGKAAGGESVPGVSLPNVPLPDATLHEACLDCSVGEEWTSHRVAEEAMIVVFGLGSDSCLVRFLCSNRYISGIDYYTRCQVIGSLRVHFMHRFCIGFILFIVLWDITHAAFLQPPGV